LRRTADTLPICALFLDRCSGHGAERPHSSRR
jgi:hypothetical protein